MDDEDVGVGGVPGVVVDGLGVDVVDAGGGAVLPNPGNLTDGKDGIVGIDGNDGSRDSVV